MSLHLSSRGIASSAIGVPMRFVRSGWLVVVLLLLVATQAAVAGSRNLARNSDFSRCFVGDGPADGWMATLSAPGGVNARVEHAGVDGGACHRLTVPDSTPIGFYMCTSVVRGLSPGDRGVLSFHVRADGVRGGYGAYAGPHYYNSTGQQIGFTDASHSLTGTTRWERLSQSFAVPPGTARVDVNLVLHGHGTAYFDRVQAEKGDRMTPWSPMEIPASSPASRPPTIAVFRDDIPPSGTASDPVRLRAMAEAAGYRAAFVNSAELADPLRLTPARYDVLVLPYGGSFPANAEEGIKSFLEGGGSLLSTDGWNTSGRNHGTVPSHSTRRWLVHDS